MAGLSFKDKRKELEEKAKKNGSTNSSATPSTSTPSVSPGKSFAEQRKKLQFVSSYSSDVTPGYIRSYFDDATSFMKGYAIGTKGIDWDKAMSEDRKKVFDNEYNSLIEREKSIRSFLQSDGISKEYRDQLTKALDSSHWSIVNAKVHRNNVTNHFSQYKSQDDWFNNAPENYEQRIKKYEDAKSKSNVPDSLSWMGDVLDNIGHGDAAPKGFEDYLKVDKYGYSRYDYDLDIMRNQKYLPKYEKMEYIELAKAKSELPDGEEKEWLDNYIQGRKEDYLMSLDGKAIEEAEKAYKNRFGDTPAFDAIIQATNEQDAGIIFNHIEALNAKDMQKKAQEKEKYLGVGDPRSEYYDPDFAKKAAAGDEEFGALAATYIIGTGSVQEGFELSQLNDKERDTLRYHYHEGGLDGAKEYLEHLQPDLARRQADYRYEKMEGNTFLEIAFGIEAGVNQFSRGLEGWFTDEPLPYNSTEILQSYVSNDLADVGPKIPFTGGKTLGQTGFDTVTTLSNMAPTLAISTVAPTTGAVLMGASAGGNAYQEKLRAGYSADEAAVYGILVGTSEALLERFIGSAAKVSGKGLTKLTGKALDSMDNVFSRFAKTWGGQVLVNAGSEGFEEFLQAVLEPYLWQIASGEEATVEWEEAAYNALMGAFTGGMLGGGMATVKSGGTAVKQTKTGRSVLNANKTEGLIGISNDTLGIAPDSSKRYLEKQIKNVGDKVSSLAEKNAKRAEKGKSAKEAGWRTAKAVGKLYDTVSETTKKANRSQDVADISARLKEFGRSDHKKMADAIVASVNREELSRSQVKLLKTAAESKAVQTVLDEIVNNPESDYGKRRQALSEFTAEVNLSSLIAAAKKASAKEKGVKLAEAGKAVNPDGFVEEDGELKVKTDDGTVSHEDMRYDSTEQGIAYETIYGLGITDAAEANRLLNGHTEADGLTDSEWSEGVTDAFLFGRAGVDFDAMATTPTTAKLLDTQRMAAYRIGQNHMGETDTQDNIDLRNALKEEGKRLKRKPGEKGVYVRNQDGSYTKVSDYMAANKDLNKRQTTAIRVMQEFSDVMGARVNLFQAFEENGKKYYINHLGKKIEGNPNGFYDKSTGEIYVAMDAGATKANAFTDTMLFTFAHEVTHFIKDWSPTHFEKIASTLIRQAGFDGKMADLIADQQDKAMRIRKEKISEETALEELVADSMETILRSGRVVETMAKIKNVDAEAHAKLKGWFKKLRRFLRRMVNVYGNQNANTAEGKIVEGFAEDLLQQLEQMFAEGAVEAGRNYQAAREQDIDAKENTTDEGGVSMMDRMTDSDIRAVQSIGRISLNKFSASNIKTTERFALQYWKEMNVKSPFFRAWFGDWRVKDPTRVQVANQKGDARVTQKNTDTGWDIQVSGQVFNETKRHTKPYNVAAKPYLPYINSIVENAILLDSFGIDPDKLKSPNSLLMHSLYAIADIGNGREIIKLYVEEMNDPNAQNTSKRAYQLQNIEKYQLQNGSSQKTASSIRSTTGTIRTVADLFAAVKQKDSSFRPNQTSKIVNPNGAPKVMYHGSPAKFTIFDKKKAKSSGLYGRGFYFTDSESHASTYGERYAVYLNIKNPLQSGGATVTRAQVQKFLESVAENEDYSIENYGSYDIGKVLQQVMGKSAKADAFQVIQDISATAIGDMVEAAELFNRVNGTKFDGIVVPTETVAFYPEQIKSATDNIGTFDGSNPDMNYSDRDEGPVFYSQMAKVVDAVKQEKLGAASVVSMLRGKGVKAEEIKWSGIEEWLAGKKSVTKAELQEFIAGSMLQIEERFTKRYGKKELQQLDALVKEYIPDYLHPNGASYFAAPDSLAEDLEIMKMNGLKLPPKDVQDRMIALAESGASGRWRSYTLPGGKNYREVTFKLPGSEYSNNSMVIHWGKNAAGIIAHARLQDFRVNGKKMLFVEEIQSDWHNQGGKEGYVAAGQKRASEIRKDSANAYAEFAESDVISALVSKLSRAGVRNADAYMERVFDGDQSAFDYISDHVDLTDAEMNAIEQAASQQMQRVDEAYTAPSDEAAPDAPFKDAYHEFVMKRLIREAAENGYDIIGWTTADIQSKRWSDEFEKAYANEYDKKIPSFMKKVGKKWGTDVTTMSLNGTEIWAMPISKAMKESVMTEGQPLFQERGTGAAETRLRRQRDAAKDKARSVSKDLRTMEKEFLRLVKQYDRADAKAGKAAAKSATRIDDLKAALRKEAASHWETRKTWEAEFTRLLREYERSDRNVERLEERLQRQRDAIEAKAESIKKTVVKHSIRKKIMNLNKLFSRGTKEKNVKAGMRDFAASALASADILFTDTVTNQDLIRNGIGTELTEAESKLLNKTADLMAKINDLSGYANLTKRDELEAKMKRNMTALRDVFARERARLEKATIAGVLNDLAEEYHKLESAKEPHLQNTYSEAVYKYLTALQETVGGTKIKDMSLSQLESLNKAYEMVLGTIQAANKIFRNGRYEDAAARTDRVQSELKKISASEKDPTAKGAKVADFLRSFTWNELRPVDAFERLGSEAMKELFWDLVYAQGEFGRMAKEIADVFETARKKYGYSKWDLNTAKEYDTVDGKKFRVTLLDRMSIYAYSKRPQADDHMTDGGFVFDSTSTYKDKKSGVKRKHKKLSSPYRLSNANITEIANSLSEAEKAYVDEIQNFMKEFGERGNTVSRALYGVDLFTEEAYFPLQSEKDFINTTDQALNSTATMVSLKNTGMTKPTVPHANNPIVLRAFDDIVLDHLDTMSKYIAYVLPIENIQKVYNSVGRVVAGDNGYVSTQALIGSKFGAAAQQYFEQFIKDLNGASFTAGAKSPLEGMFSKGKAAAIAANASVMIQQYSAVIRAMSEISPQYMIPFLNASASRAADGKIYDELIKYAPVAVIKEMGGYDTGSSRTLKEYVQYRNAPMSTEKAMSKAKDAFSWGAQQMDKIGWSTIWRAVKKEIADTTDLKIGSEEFLQACGKRFTEVVTKTQVYDSVISRSGFMRSKHSSVKYLTTYMGEPTVIVGMLFSSHLELVRAIKSKDGRRIWKAARKTLRTGIAVAGSSIVNELLKALVYAARDDDEDEAYLERVAKHFGDGLSGQLSPLNLFNLLPGTRDIVSLFEGFDVDRPDVTLIGDLIKSSFKLYDAFGNEDADLVEASLNFLGDLGNMFGIPAENIIRDMKATFNFYDDMTDEIYPTNVGGAFAEGFTGEEPTKHENLYDVIVRGEKGRIDALKKGYVDEDGNFDQDKYDTAVRKALRDGDPRIREAAIAYQDGDYTEYDSIMDEIEAEGNFDREIIAGAVKAEHGAMFPSTTTGSSGSNAKAEYDGDDLRRAIVSGDADEIGLVKDNMIQTAIANGKTEDEANKSFMSTARSEVKKAFKEDSIDEDKAVDLLVEYGQEEEAAVDTVNHLAFQLDYPEYKELSMTDVRDWYEYAEGVVPLDIYYDFTMKAKDIEGDDRNGDGKADSGSKKRKLQELARSYGLTGAQIRALMNTQ